jgi:hypothetical protein
MTNLRGNPTWPDTAQVYLVAVTRNHKRSAPPGGKYSRPARIVRKAGSITNRGAPRRATIAVGLTAYFREYVRCVSIFEPLGLFDRFARGLAESSQSRRKCVDMLPFRNNVARVARHGGTLDHRMEPAFGSAAESRRPLGKQIGEFPALSATLWSASKTRCSSWRKLGRFTIGFASARSPGRCAAQGPGGAGRGGFGPKARALSRCGRLVRAISR